MAKGGVRVTLDRQALEQITSSPGGLTDQAVARAAGAVRDKAKRNITNAGRVDTGALRNSGITRRISSGTGIWYEVAFETDYAMFQHEGVKGPVLPRRAKVLRFKPKGSSSFVFARSTKGFKGVPYLRNALNTLSTQDYL